MTGLFRFSDVRCEESERTFSFTLCSGETRLLQLDSRAEKEALIDLSIGETECRNGLIEIMQGDRRHFKSVIMKPLNDRRRNHAPLPMIWQPLNACQAGSVGWVAGNGGLISNLKIWENVCLPLWYHGRREIKEAELSVMYWLDELGLEPEAGVDFMAAQPYSLEIWQRKLASLLRGLLQKKSILVVDADIFEDINPRWADRWSTALENYAGLNNAVLLISGRSTTLPWQMIK
jgi:ABC-type multidrug transport system ATPase subunit